MPPAATKRMNSPRPPERSAPPKPPSPADDAVSRRNNRRAIGLGAAVIVLVTAGVYANSWAVPFVFDDHAAISSNASIRHLADLAAVLSPPGEGLTVDGRPILNLSLAVNYAISGTDPWSYHALNITLHTMAALVLFGIVRRSLVRTAAPAAGGEMAEGHSASRAATALGFAVALLWSIHPLQTESVTYVIQRAESLMGLFYFLTLYGFIRATEPTEPRPSAGWYGLSWLACLAGMGTKEVMVSAPLIVWAYDALIVSGGWRSAFARRRRYYLALLLTTGILLGLALRTGSRGGTSGFGLDVTPWMYWPTQFQAVVHYLRLAVWPSPLVFDYGVQWTTGAAEVLPYAVPVVALVGVTAVAVWRQRAVGFLGLFFFAILAPTSIVPGNRQTLSEHRMYLPLAAVIVLLVVLIVSLFPVARRRQLIAWGWLPLAGLALPLAVLTVRRNETYRSELALYQDTVTGRPGNASARINLGNLLRDSQQYEEAIAHYEEALRLRPNYPQAHYNLAIALKDSGRAPLAVAHYEEALRLKPDYPEAHNNLAIALARSGRDAEALTHLAAAVGLSPAYAEAHFNLGLVLTRLGRVGEAIGAFDQALRVDPRFFRAHEARAYALQIAGRDREAAAEMEIVTRLKSASREAGKN